jgi:hypothetical protein
MNPVATSLYSLPIVIGWEKPDRALGRWVGLGYATDIINIEVEALIWWIGYSSD